MSEPLNGEEFPPLTTLECLEIIYEARATFGDEDALELAKAFGMPWALAFDGLGGAIVHPSF